MPDKNGRHPIEVIAEVQSIELNLDHSGAYKLRLQDGSTVKADFTGLQWGSFEGMHQQGRYWSGVPTDGAKNMHHYLYGRPKVDE